MSVKMKGIKTNSLKVKKGIRSELFVYSAGNDNTVRKIDSNGNEVWVFTGHTSNVWGVAVDQNGYVYSVSSDNTVRKIDPDGNEVWIFTGHTDNVRVVAVDPGTHGAGFW